MSYKIELGEKGENIAKKYLIKNNYKIIETNFRCKFGEIDIIAIDGENLVFVEVKTRTDIIKFGQPIEAINKKKQNSILKTAQFYINKNNLGDIKVRIDVLEVIIKEDIQIKLTKGIF